MERSSGRCDNKSNEIGSPGNQMRAGCGPDVPHPSLPSVCGRPTRRPLRVSRTEGAARPRRQRGARPPGGGTAPRRACRAAPRPTQGQSVPRRERPTAPPRTRRGQPSLQAEAEQNAELNRCWATGKQKAICWGHLFRNKRRTEHHSVRRRCWSVSWVGYSNARNWLV